MVVVIILVFMRYLQNLCLFVATRGHFVSLGNSQKQRDPRSQAYKGSGGENKVTEERAGAKEGNVEGQNAMELLTKCVPFFLIKNC